LAKLASIETVVFLQSVDLFSFCRAEEILRIAAIAQETRFDPGDKIYGVNDAADFLYCVVQGNVKLAGSDGSERIVYPLSTFGGIEILSGRLRMESAVAETESLLLSIEAADFFDLLSNNIDIVKALFRHVIREFQKRD
jgi:CRP-like cAMP-binding protein